MKPQPDNSIVLVSHVLCPYVQRAAIVLAEKQVPHTRRDVDLAHKPEWFTRISPLGKTPVLLVGQEAVFESAVICEYLDDTLLPRLHPDDPLQRARQRGWMEFGSAMLNDIARFYNAATANEHDQVRATLLGKLRLLEQALDADGPWFQGQSFGMVDAVFAPVFRYFDAFEAMGEPGFLDGLPGLGRWRKALAARPSVVQAVAPGFAARLIGFLRARPSVLATGRRTSVATLVAPPIPPAPPAG
jgi:glutathione S-transferase